MASCHRMPDSIPIGIFGLVFMEPYLIPEMDYHLEAYEYGAQFYKEYLNGSRPFLWHHYFEVHYWKQFVKRILKNLQSRECCESE